MKLEAAQRLRAWEESPTSKTGMWKDVSLEHSDTLDHIRSQTDFKTQSGNVKGYTVHCNKTKLEWVLLDDAASKLVAIIELSPFKKIPTVETAAVNPEYQGQALGFAFYEYLIKKFKRLSSSTHLSPGGSKIWSKLVRAHSGVILLPTGEQIEIQGFAVKGQYIYPVVLRDKQLVSLGDVKTSSIAERRALSDFTYLVSY